MRGRVEENFNKNGERANEQEKETEKRRQIERERPKKDND